MSKTSEDFFAAVVAISDEQPVARVIGDADWRLLIESMTQGSVPQNRVFIVLGGNAYMSLLHGHAVEPAREVRTVCLAGQQPLTETFANMFQRNNLYTHRCNGYVGHWCGCHVMSDVDLLRSERVSTDPAKALYPSAVYVVILDDTGENPAQAKHFILG